MDFSCRGRLLRCHVVPRNSITLFSGIQKSFIYDEQRLALDRYIIVEPDETWQIFNWVQCYTPQMLEAELEKNGLVISAMTSHLTGAPLTSGGDFIGVIANPV